MTRMQSLRECIAATSVDNGPTTLSADRCVVFGVTKDFVFHRLQVIWVQGLSLKIGTRRENL